MTPTTQPPGEERCPVCHSIDYLGAERHPAQKAHTSALQDEPKRAEFLCRIRAIARDSGYAIAVHGSQERDLDLIAAPWIVDAAEPSELVKRICDELTVWPNPDSPSPNPETKPHGRLSWALIGSLPESWVYVDLSVAAWQLPSEWALQDELDALRSGLLKAERHQVLDGGEQPEVRLRYETEAQADAVADLLSTPTNKESPNA